MAICRLSVGATRDKASIESSPDTDWSACGRYSAVARMLKSLKRMPESTSRSRPRAATSHTGESSIGEPRAGAARLLERGFADVENVGAYLGEYCHCPPPCVSAFYDPARPRTASTAPPATHRRAARNRIRAGIRQAVTAVPAETDPLRP